MSKITLYDLLPGEMKNRVVLDYPLDLLLNRACKLSDYAEKALYHRVRELTDAAKALLRNRPDQAEAIAAAYKQNPDQTDPPALADPSREWTEYWAKRKAMVGLAGSPDRFAGKIGSLVIPRGSRTEPVDAKDRIEAASGNILIRGRPGTCKTTLALQCAVRCTRSPNHYSAVFISLEESSERILEKCRIMGWDRSAGEAPGVVELRGLADLDASSSTEELAKTLAEILRGYDPATPDVKGVREGKVVLPMLSPRSIRASGSEALFVKRYEQLERLLRAFRWLRNNEGFEDLPHLRVLCIDSLSALADRPLRREEIYRVFDLFSTYGVIGIVTIEAQDRKTADSLADVIIELHSDQDDGYALRYLEISKSRHQHQVYGLHPFVVRHLDDFREERGPTAGLAEGVNDTRADFFQSLMVYPSIHYLTYSTRPLLREGEQEPKGTRGRAEVSQRETFDIGIKGLERVLTGGLLKRPSIVTVKGPRGSYKSHIARNFLLAGLAKDESCILINLGATKQFNPTEWKLNGTTPWLSSPEVAESIKKNAKNSGCPYEQLRNDRPPKNETGIDAINTSKFCRDVWRYNHTSGSTPILVEFDFKPGALLPEQFLKHVRDAFRQLRMGQNLPRFRRLVLDDVSLIGTSYPRLRQSRTVGDLFLTAFVHFARYFELDVIMVGTSGEFAEADAVVRRASTLADSVLTCDFCEVFGDRLITVTGDGLMASHGSDTSKDDSAPSREYGEFVPGVVEPLKGHRFTVDLDKLEGLVGFQTGQIHRPGVVVNLFSEGRTLGKYNDEIRTLLECAFASTGQSTSRASDGPSRGAAQSDVVVREFGWDKSTAIHDSLRVLRGKPVDKTVVCALDEFYSRSLVEGADGGEAGPEESGLCVLDASSKASPAAGTPAGPRLDGSRLDFAWENFRPVFWPGEKRQETIIAAPYYSNVLVLAYHEALVAPLKEHWERKQKEGAPDRLASWAGLLQAARSGGLRDWRGRLAEARKGSRTGPANSHSGQPKDWRLIEFGDPSVESLSCILLDALAQKAKSKKDMRDLTAGLLKRQEEIADELAALSQLACMTADERQREQVLRRVGKSRSKQQATHLTRIYPYAGVYVAWYTQIRELVADYPELASSLRVAALPGGGVRGDWYLGVLRGSVSVTLGRRIIKMLCGRDEDNRRFVEGVGLPTHQGYDEPGIYMAWPRAEVDLATVLAIHQEARARSQTKGYMVARAALGALGEQMRNPPSDRTDHRKALKGFLSRLPRMVDLVYPRP
jgi:KaiC/GvpD/RAD55 family RecA-like ATPase